MIWRLFYKEIDIENDLEFLADHGENLDEGDNFDNENEDDDFFGQDEGKENDEDNEQNNNNKTDNVKRAGNLAKRNKIVQDKSKRLKEKKIKLTFENAEDREMEDAFN